MGETEDYIVCKQKLFSFWGFPFPGYALVPVVNKYDDDDSIPKLSLSKLILDLLRLECFDFSDVCQKWSSFASRKDIEAFLSMLRYASSLLLLKKLIFTINFNVISFSPYLY